MAGSAVTTGEEAWSATWSPKSRPSAITREREVAVGDEPDRLPVVVDQHDRADVALAHQLGDLAHRPLAARAVTTSLGHDLADQHGGASLQSRAVAHRTPGQLANRRRVETVIGFVVARAGPRSCSPGSASRAWPGATTPTPSRRASGAAGPGPRWPGRRARPSAAARVVAVSEPLRDPQEQLDWEAKQRPRAAVAAALGGLLVFGGQIGRQVALQDAPRARFLDGLESVAAPGDVGGRDSLQMATAEYLDDHVLGMIVPSVIEALGYFAVAYALTFLAAATRARRKEMIKLALYLPAVGGVLMGVSTIPARLAGRRRQRVPRRAAHGRGGAGHRPGRGQPRGRGPVVARHAGARRRAAARRAQRDARGAPDALHGHPRRDRRRAAGDPHRAAAARADVLVPLAGAAAGRPPPGRRAARVAHRPRGAVAHQREVAEARQGERQAATPQAAEPAAATARARRSPRTASASASAGRDLPRGQILHSSTARCS